MTELWGVKPPLLWLALTNRVLFASALVLFIVYLVRLFRGSRSGYTAPSSGGQIKKQLNLRVFTGVVTVLMIGFGSFLILGTFTDRPLLSEVGGLFVNVMLLYIFVVFLRWRLW